MTVSGLLQTPGRRYPARRLTQQIAGGASPIQPKNFACGMITLDPDGGQTPWHNQQQEELYFVIDGEVEVCLGEERRTLTQGQAVYIPPTVFHQITNTGKTYARFLYVYGPSGDVAHWRQELEGTLPKAGVDAPPLPAGARPQCTEPPSSPTPG